MKKLMVFFLVMSSWQGQVQAMAGGFAKPLDALKGLREAITSNKKTDLEAAIARYQASTPEIKNNAGVLPKFKEATAALAKLAGGFIPAPLPVPVPEKKGDLAGALAAARGVKEAMTAAKKAATDANLTPQEKQQINDAAGIALF